MAPERLLADAPPAPLLDRHAERAARAVAHRVPALDRVLAADPAQLLGEDRAVFDPVPVGVDDRMVKPRLDLPSREMSAHRGLLERKLRWRDATAAPARVQPGAERPRLPAKSGSLGHSISRNILERLLRVAGPLARHLQDAFA